MMNARPNIFIFLKLSDGNGFWKFLGFKITHIFFQSCNWGADSRRPEAFFFRQNWYQRDEGKLVRVASNLKFSLHENFGQDRTKSATASFSKPTKV